MRGVSTDSIDRLYDLVMGGYVDTGKMMVVAYLYPESREEVVSMIADLRRSGLCRESREQVTGDTVMVTTLVGDTITLAMSIGKDQVSEDVIVGTRTVSKPDPNAPLVLVSEDVTERKYSSVTEEAKRRTGDA